MNRLTEHDLFLDYIYEYIKLENVNLLLIAGDIFDTINPSREAEKQYFNFLKKIAKLKFCKVLVLAGNHDSVAHLSASKNLLKVLDIAVVSQFKNEFESLYYSYDVPDLVSSNLIDDHAEKLDNQNLADLSCDINYHNKPETAINECIKSNRKVHVLALPFLREQDLRKLDFGIEITEKDRAEKQALKQIYRQAAEFLKFKVNDNDFKMITGHLTITGSQNTDSEREIHIGGLAGNLTKKDLNEVLDFDYVALGHLHKPQKLAEHIYYSGSPIPMSFSEAQQDKFFNLITIDSSGHRVEKQKIPKFRNFYRLNGDLAFLTKKLIEIAAQDETNLKPWLEVSLKQNTYMQHEINQLHKQAKDLDLEILKLLVLKTDASDLKLTGEYTQIKDLTVLEVFNKKIESLAEEEREPVLDCFKLLLEESYQLEDLRA
jgi:exonuclease SbcD